MIMQNDSAFNKIMYNRWKRRAERAEPHFRVLMRINITFIIAWIVFTMSEDDQWSKYSLIGQLISLAFATPFAITLLFSLRRAIYWLNQEKKRLEAERDDRE